MTLYRHIIYYSVVNERKYSYILVYKCPQITAKYSYQNLKHKDHMQNLITNKHKNNVYQHQLIPYRKKSSCIKMNRKLCIYWGMIIWTMNEIYELKALYKGTETTEPRVSFFFQNKFDLFLLHTNELLLFSLPRKSQLSRKIHQSV